MPSHRSGCDGAQQSGYNTRSGMTKSRRFSVTRTSLCRSAVAAMSISGRVKMKPLVAEFIWAGSGRMFWQVGGDFYAVCLGGNPGLTGIHSSIFRFRTSDSHSEPFTAAVHITRNDYRRSPEGLGQSLEKSFTRLPDPIASQWSCSTVKCQSSSRKLVFAGARHWTFTTAFSGKRDVEKLPDRSSACPSQEVEPSLPPSLLSKA